jgi:hypothetical protein
MIETAWKTRWVGWVGFRPIRPTHDGWVGCWALFIWPSHPNHPNHDSNPRCRNKVADPLASIAHARPPTSNVSEPAPAGNPATAVTRSIFIRLMKRCITVVQRTFSLFSRSFL